jgi:hypothetical protein
MKAKRIVCKGCGKELASVRGLQRHFDYCEKYHMNRRIVKTCRYCGKQFVDLMRHLNYCEEYHIKRINKDLREMQKVNDSDWPVLEAR